ncbi:hypothetical protein SO802_023969 [Lithocarpus litseifolius]|uniref:Uncharacterized protein n=1 Tax=Lithocarpus litseifolius TaxID=425828 RepID=A0AAW2C7R1_9ROSI
MGFLHASSSFLSSSSQFHLPSLQPYSHSRRITKLHSRTFHSIFTTITMPPPQPFPQIPKLSHTTTHLVHHRSHTNIPFTLHASPHNSHSTATTTNSKLIFITSSLTIALAVANRVLYKLALVPMKQYPFFLAQVTTFGGSNADQMLSGVDFMWPVLMIASSAFQAGASIIKEFVFTDAATRLKGRSLDIFVVNSLGSGFQALFVLFFLPFLSRVKGIPLGQLPSYLKSGAGCFLNFGANVPGCDGAPLLPLLYIMINLAFNISVLNVVKISSAVVSSLTVMLSVPISIYILSLQLPYLPEATSLSPFFLLGSLILVSGLVIYSIPQPAKHDSRDC